MAPQWFRRGVQRFAPPAMIRRRHHSPPLLPCAGIRAVVTPIGWSGSLFALIVNGRSQVLRAETHPFLFPASTRHMAATSARRRKMDQNMVSVCHPCTSGGQALD